MENSKQKLLLSLLIEFKTSFTKQINESVIDQEMEKFIKDSVQELANKQYRGSLFDQKISKLIETVDYAIDDKHLVLNEYNERLWVEISQIAKRTTSFETAYSLIDIFNSKKNSKRSLNL